MPGGVSGLYPSLDKQKKEAKKEEKKEKWYIKYLPQLILLFVAALCFVFILLGATSEDGSRTLDGKNAKIEEGTTEWIESAREAYNRITNESKPTDEETIKEWSEGFGKGGYSATLQDVIGRRLADGNNDNGNGWQCSRYSAWLGTGQWSYSTAHPDYGPVNGKDVAAWLVKNYGWKYIDTPIEGSIGSGGFNTLYGHTAMYLYSTGSNTAMVNDANWVPLTVSTHNMNIDGWVWVVPGDYTPDPEPTPTPTPTPTPDDGTVTYSYVPGDSFGKVLIKLGLDEGHLWGEDGTVKYYTKQLIEQNMLDARGNVLLYTPFTLRKK